MLLIRTRIKKNRSYCSLRKKVTGVRKIDNTQRIYLGSDELVQENDHLLKLISLFPNK